MSASGTIDELLVRWQELRRQGDPPSIKQLCADHPSLADELARRVAAFESMEALLGVGVPATLDDRSPRPEVPRHFADKLLPLGFELIEVIDQGGMGIVYKATQIKLRRTVAIKMLIGYVAGPKQLARFRAEAEAVARLQHPNIVQIYEVGEADGHSYFAMEFVEGGTLAHRFAEGPLPGAAAADLIETLARAVHHAHSRGIVHRDLKPGNILLRGDVPTLKSKAGDVPAPKIADFGLAKRLGTESDHSAAGDVIGTPNYMAPEQAEGRIDAVGPACDVYSLGAILYEALTGRPPFRANTILETLRRVVSDEPEHPSRLRAGIPRDLEAICLKCLEKCPTHRYPSAEALAEDLHRFAKGFPVTARPLSRPARVLRWMRRRPVPTAGILLIAIIPLAAAGWRHIEQEKQRARVVQRAVDVAPQAREILVRHCYECHGAKVERKFLVLDRSSLLDPSRKNVVPGQPEHSRMIQRIVDGTMPPEDQEADLPRVSEHELSILRDWIAGGAPEFPPEDPHTPTPSVIPRSELAARVKVIFLQHCHSCHSFSEAKGGIKILNHDLLTLTRKVVIPGRPMDSELYQLLVSGDESAVMPPPEQPRMTADEIETVRQWIEAGAAPFPRTAPAGKK